MPTREGRRSGALSISHRPHDDLLIVVDPDDDPPSDHSARLAEASATLGSLDAAAAVVASSGDPAKQDTAP